MGTMNLKMLLESKELERCPFPIPVGWFHVDFSENLKVGEIRNVELFGQEWVLFRTESGKPGMSDPYCPHLGAHMGHGGKVCGEHLRCPFHHWEYDADGWCKSIPYAKVMPPIVKKQAILRITSLPPTSTRWRISASITPTSPICTSRIAGGIKVTTCPGDRVRRRLRRYCKR